MRVTHVFGSALLEGKATGSRRSSWTVLAMAASLSRLARRVRRGAVATGHGRAQSPIDETVDVDVLGTNTQLELRIGPSQRPAEPVQPGEPPPAPTTPAPRGTFDDQMAEITRVVPDFGGVFVNERAV